MGQWASIVVIQLALFISQSTFGASVPLWDRFETVVENNREYDNPFKDVVLDAEFTSPSGKQVLFFGYYDGDGKGGQEGSVWRLRFMPNEVGEWTYRCRFSDGSPGSRGSFSCTRHGAKPGPLRTQGRWLRFADGSAFYARSYYLSELFFGESPYWEQKTDLIFGGTYGYNMCCTTFWQGRLLKSHRWNNLPYNEFHPIVDGDYTRLDLASWKHVDKVLERLASRGTVWYNFDGFIPNVGGGMSREQRGDFEAQKVYVRNALARLAPYWNVTWNVVFEWWEFLTVDQVRQLVDYIKSNDPWDHLIGVHDQGARDNEFANGKDIIESLRVDFVTLQYDMGKCGNAVTASAFIQKYGGNWPVYAQEVCWESSVKLNGDQVRRGSWGVVLAGGILNYAEMFEDKNFRSPDNYGDGEAFSYLEILFDFIQSLPYTRMAPDNKLVSAGVVCLAAPDSNYVCYAQEGGEIELDLTEATAAFTAEWLNPRTGDKTGAGLLKGGSKRTLSSPDQRDWVLHVFNKR